MAAQTQKRTFIIDTSTKNYHFLKMYQILKTLKVKNNKFFLRLYDQDLVGVDPHSKLLTPKQKEKIIQECTINPWYFLREVIRVVVNGGYKPFAIHRGNLALIYCILHDISLILVLPRQNFKSISTAGILAWIILFATKNTKIIIGNKSFGDAKENLSRIRDIVSELPEWMVPKDKDNIANTEAFGFAHNKNKITAMPAPSSAVHGDKLG